MDPTKHLVLCKGVVKTGDVRSFEYNDATHTVDVEFEKGRKPYSYNQENFEYLSSPKTIDPAPYQICKKGGMHFSEIDNIYSFQGDKDTYWYLHSEAKQDPADINGRTFRKADLNIRKSCLDKGLNRTVFAYIKELASLIKISNHDDDTHRRSEQRGEFDLDNFPDHDYGTLLARKFEKIFVGDDTALAQYLDPSSRSQEKPTDCAIPIFPFGCNNSQYVAVQHAMENQISVIQGPPGTGKTQTILNIIANVLMQGKTVLVVSNNNAATDNVYEKLAQHGLDFVVARLGNNDNKDSFILEQSGSYPDFSTWKCYGDFEDLRNEIEDQTAQLGAIFDQQEKLAHLKQEESQLATEHEHFKQCVDETDANIGDVKALRKLSGKQWVKLWRECQDIAEEQREISLFFRIKAFVRYGIYDSRFFKQDLADIITALQAKFYDTRKKELAREITDAAASLRSIDKGLQGDLSSKSMLLLKGKLTERYGGRKKRPLFEADDLWKHPDKVVEEYPVVTSTTFSSTSSLKNIVYDYLVMDEASQVDIATGSLALSCAQNAVIVGDTKQLPNIVDKDVKAGARTIYDDRRISSGYHYEKSFLQSVIDVIPDVKQTLLREHYRCHPKIINFCNQKFYRGELIVMTEDKGEKDALFAMVTAPGNHERDRFNQRQIDVIRREILPECDEDTSEIGIIAPYRKQVSAVEETFPDIEASTVHKFQGREKDTIILSTVDDEISDFVDDPYLINVAVSRAKHRLMLVVTGNPQTRESNIADLLDYIRYNNFEVADSKIYSIFDYLYKQYNQARIDFLKRRRKVSEYDSENLMHALIEDVLADDKYACLDVACRVPLNKLIRDIKQLNDREAQYVRNPATHVDFLIYNRISKRPTLAIEVDGYEFHRRGTPQASRDVLKNKILESYELPLLRFSTIGSGEKEKLTNKLDEIVASEKR